MQKKVLIAVGDKAYTDILKETFEKKNQNFVLSSQEVFHRRYLTEIVQSERPDILILHDYYLESDFIREEQKEQELLTFIRDIRVTYNDALRVVFMCERPKGDSLLTKLVSLGIMDIINENSFDLDDFIVQLQAKPHFSNVEKFLVMNSIESIVVTEKEKKEEERSPSKEEKTEKPVVQKVIEKKVIQKVVNKNVIKRDYKIQITNNTEKVVGIPVNKKLIMIGSPFSRSGSTFISHILARALTQLGVTTTYIESPFSKAYTYDRFIGHHDTKAYRSKFYQLNKLRNSVFDYEYNWQLEKVDIICKHPTSEPIYKEEDVAFEQMIKILFSSPSIVTIMDVGIDWPYALYQDMLDIADHIYFILEPDIPSIQYLEESESQTVEIIMNLLKHDKTHFIGNRFEQSLMKNQLLNGLFANQIKTTFPAFSTTDVFQCQMKGMFLNDYKEYQKRIYSSVQPLIEDILPPDFLVKQRKNSGFFKGIFNKKVTVEKNESKGETTTV
ncbi:hypothetical protein FAY30_26365 (plasmid) [Bacillus sp. S3]|uniref:hypothetical protein n=1 Tax=Bacillus sp. S3 TaxID=486398 RepID=UPI00118C3D7B|nr:hypothetical protein [Bacillus sp. S3]QCJ45467.1 hypothetical protein FAY30_26365 [Bacillus sp. S3]